MNNVSLWIKEHPLAAFFALAYALSWWSVPVDGTQFAFGPLLVAIVVSTLLGGKAELMAWLRHCTQWRAGLGWYALALLWDPLESTCRHASLSIL